MIKKVREKTKGWQIHKQLIVLILLTGMVSVLLFEVLWLNKWNIYEYVRQIPGLHDVSLDEDFWEDLRAEATKYDIPSSEDDKAGIKKIQPFLEQGDKYTGIYIYALKEGNYITGRFPKVLENAAFSTFFDMGYQLTGGEGEETYEFPMKFKNGYATVMVWFYHRVRFIYPYCIFSLTVSIGLFFTVILFFIKKKMNLVAELKDEILRMAAGNLRDSVPNMGQDEIGIIAEELDNLRVALQDTLVREKESRRANQDLITAMSHDLRTPLTILNGYLEVLRLNRNPEMHEEYLKRCLQKTSDIREMTDRMFEYALVFEEGEEPKVKKAYYIFNEAGVLQTGKKRLVTVKKKQYYAAKNGKALSGIYYIKNKFYAFNKNGACNQKKTKKLKAAAKYNKNFKKLKKLLGKPKKTKYESYSCYGPGNDGYIKYANFTVYVYKYKGKVLYMGAE